MDSLALALTLTDTPNDPVKYRDRFFTDIETMENVELARIETERKARRVLIINAGRIIKCFSQVRERLILRQTRPL